MTATSLQKITFAVLLALIFAVSAGWLGGAV